MLAAVFVPVAFLGGITGELYKQFAITIALSVAISGFVALTLSPACVRWFSSRAMAPPRDSGIYSTGLLTGCRPAMSRTVGIILKRSLIALAIFANAGIRDPGLFKTIPGSFLPEEDQGYFITIVQLPEGASLTRTIEVLRRVERYF